MNKKQKRDATCKFCGKHRTVEYWEEDGMDFYGHARGNINSGIIDEGCDCSFGKLARSKVSIKPMCINCKSYKSGCCINEKMLKKLTGMFDMGDKLRVNKPECKCEYYEINFNVFADCIKGDRK